MAGKNNGLDAIMAIMALKTLMNDTKDLAIHPFTIEVTVTPGSIGCSASGNRKFLEDLDGGIEWLDETNDRVKDIMAEQTTKLAELMKKKFGFETVAADSNSEDGFAKFMETLFGGGRTIANKTNNLPTVVFYW